jgi:hydroxymethylglutaryl-CoA lyase
MLPQKVVIREVGLRDGLQPEKLFVPTEEKVALADALVGAGLRQIEATSFVSPRAVPQMRDAAELARALDRSQDVIYSALVANVRGARDAVDAGMCELQIVVSCSDTHSRKNVKMPKADSLGQAAAIAVLAREHRVAVRAALATTFGCPYEGDIPFATVYSLIDELQAAGIKRFSLADTAGLANPRQMSELCSEVVRKYPCVEFSLHLHDTRGMALACVLAGLSSGITVFESSIGGLGGCPFIPQATGNVATEDLVYMLEAMGIQTGLDWQKLMDAAMLAEKILGRPLASRQLALANGRCQPV